VKPEDRFQTAEEFRVALESFLLSRGLLAEARAKLGGAVAELCTKHRTELKNVIEKQLTAVNARSGDLTPMMVTIHSDRDRSGRRDLLATENSAPNTSTGTMSTAGRMTRFAIAGIVGVSLVAAGVVIFKRRADETRASAVITAATAAQPEAPAMVAIAIATTPPGATVYIDGNRYTAPYETKLPQSSAKHTVRVEADGYQPQSQEVAFDRDLNLSIALSKVVAVAPPAVRAASPPAVAAGPFAWAPAPAKANTKTTATPAESVNSPPPKETSSAGATTAPPASSATAARQKKDIDRANPFSGASSGAGVKDIDKSNPFGK
jgi:hypothetical protein